MTLKRGSLPTPDGPPGGRWRSGFASTRLHAPAQPHTESPRRMRLKRALLERTRDDPPSLYPLSGTRHAAPCCARCTHKAASPDGESMVLPIEAYIDACARHNESPLEPISTALSSEASGGLRIANLKLVHTHTHPHAMPSRSLTRRALRSRTPARCVSAPPSRTLPASLRSPSVT